MNTPNFTVLSEEEQKKKTEDNRSGKTITLVRLLYNNLDLVAILFVALFFLAIGYSFAKIYLCLSFEQIKVGITEIIYLILLILSGVGAIIGKLSLKQGKISEKLNGKTTILANKIAVKMSTLLGKIGKDRDKIDEYGRSIIGK